MNGAPSRPHKARPSAPPPLVESRLIAHFDHNTFFNENGAGTNINRMGNAQLSLSIFAWVTRNDADEGVEKGSESTD